MSEQDYIYLSEHGKCAQDNIEREVFFPEGSSEIDLFKKEEAAKAICRQCSVAALCLQVAVQNYEYGIWGGTTERDRQGKGRTARELARIQYRIRSSQMKEFAITPQKGLGSNKERAARAGLNSRDKFIKAQILLENVLSDAQQELVTLRIERPEASLDELGQLVTPTLNKDQVRSRLRTVLSMAKRVI